MAFSCVSQFYVILYGNEKKNIRHQIALSSVSIPVTPFAIHINWNIFAWWIKTVWHFDSTILLIIMKTRLDWIIQRWSSPHGKKSSQAKAMKFRLHDNHLLGNRNHGRTWHKRKKIYIWIIRPNHNKYLQSSAEKLSKKLNSISEACAIARIETHSKRRTEIFNM